MLVASVAESRFMVAVLCWCEWHWYQYYLLQEEIKKVLKDVCDYLGESKDEVSYSCCWLFFLGVLVNNCFVNALAVIAARVGVCRQWHIVITPNFNKASTNLLMARHLTFNLLCLISKIFHTGKSVLTCGNTVNIKWTEVSVLMIIDMICPFLGYSEPALAYVHGVWYVLTVHQHSTANSIKANWWFLRCI